MPVTSSGAPVATMTASPDWPPPLLWDIFCHVIDNHGDLGLCWRLATQLAARGQRVRLWVDDARALAWLAPQAVFADLTGPPPPCAAPGVTVWPWRKPFHAALPPQTLAALPVADVWVEAFGCEIAPEFIAGTALSTSQNAGFTQKWPVWLNLEYLSAQPYVQRMHDLPSPILTGPAAGQTKWFFYPGFTPRTGGLLQGFEAHATPLPGWLDALPPPAARLRVSLFCYEPPALRAWLTQLRGQPLEPAQPRPSQLLVTAGRARAACARLGDTLENQGNDPIAASPLRGALSISYLPYLTQPQYDQLLAACELNFVRGEDSLVRALWAGQPLVWQIYPQHDDAHHAKLAAFLDWLDAPPSLRRFHALWNGIDQPPRPGQPWPDAALPQLGLWRECVQAARARLLAQPDLVTQLIGLVAQKR